mmetsp:Transcript_7698/g.15966  ORF Transcript_7698/g.15966 Transcript_7698/m.15966 type:complete len:222 (-) Transcript_7698:15-680(-)
MKMYSHQSVLSWSLSLSLSLILVLSFALFSAEAENKPIFDQVFDAVRNDDREGIRSRVQENPRSLESIGPGGQTPLVHAVLYGKLVSVQTLLDLGADFLATEKDGYNVLHAAGFQGRAEILEALVDHFSSKQTKTETKTKTETETETLNLATDQHEDGYFPIHRACWGREDRHAETVRVMLQNGVPHDLASRDGKTCEQMTRNEGTLAALLEAKEGSSYEL